MSESNDFFFRSGVINCVVNFSGEILSTNNEWENILGIKKESILGKGYLKHIHPEDQSDTMLTALHFSVGNNLFNYKNRYLNNKGNYIVINWNATIDANKKRIYASGFPKKSKVPKNDYYSLNSPALNKTFLDSIPTMVWATDNQGKIYYLNKSWIEFTGTKAEKATEDWHKAFSESDSRTFQEKLTHSTKEHKDFFLECQLHNKNKQPFWVNISAKPRFDNNGRFIGMVGTANLIESIKIVANRLIQASKSASLGIWELDLKTNELHWDDMMYSLYEIKKNKKITYQTWKKTVLTEDVKEAEKKVDTCIKNITDQNMSFRIKTGKGKIKYIFSSFTVIADTSNKPSKMIGINSDISEQKFEEIFLKELHKIYTDKDLSVKSKLKAILQSACEYFKLEIGIISHITQDKYTVKTSYNADQSNIDNQTFNLKDTYCNETTRRNRLTKYINVAKSKIAKLPCYKQFKLNTYIGSPLHINNKFYGTVCFASTHSTREKFNDRKTSFFNLIVKTIEKQLENEDYIDVLTRKNNQLDSFAHIASHDLKEPLRSLNNYTQFLYEDYNKKLDETGKKYISRIQWQANYIRDLIDDMLAFTQISRTPEAKPEVHLDLLISDLIKSIELSFPQKDISIKIDNNIGIVKIEERILSMVYRNLITNSIKYNDKDKIIIHIGSYHDHNIKKDILYVKDNGIGIERKFHKIIFDLFKRLHGKNKYGGGTGLGLAIVKKSIEESGGKIWLESRKNKGTSFFFYF